MAVKLARQNGQWVATTTWSDGIIPVEGDIVYANGYNVSINQNTINVAELRNDASNGSRNGGYFYLDSSLTTGNFEITADIYASNTYCLQQNFGATGRQFIINGDLHYTDENSPYYAIYVWISDGGSITVNGDCYAPVAYRTATDNSSATVEVNGNYYVPQGLQFLYNSALNYYSTKGFWVLISGNIYYRSSAYAQNGFSWMQGNSCNYIQCDKFYQWEEFKVLQSRYTPKQIIYASSPTHIVCNDLYLYNSVNYQDFTYKFDRLHKIDSEGIDNTYVLYPASLNYPSQDKVLGGVTYGKDNELVGTASAVNLSETQLQRISNCVTPQILQATIEQALYNE